MTDNSMPGGPEGPPSGATAVLRPHAEQEYAGELARLAEHDDRPRPPGWRLSPWAVTEYLLGAQLDNGFTVSPKYIGDRRLIEVAVATLATDRALLLRTLSYVQYLLTHINFDAHYDKLLEKIINQYLDDRAAASASASASRDAKDAGAPKIKKHKSGDNHK